MDTPERGAYCLQVRAEGFDPVLTEVFEVNNRLFCKGFGDLRLKPGTHTLKDDRYRLRHLYFAATPAPKGSRLNTAPRIG